MTIDVEIGQTYWFYRPHYDRLVSGKVKAIHISSDGVTVLCDATDKYVPRSEVFLTPHEAAMARVEAMQERHAAAVVAVMQEAEKKGGA